MIREPFSLNFNRNGRCEFHGHSQLFRIRPDKVKRELIFKEYLNNNPQIHVEEILNFHLTGNTGNTGNTEHNLIMARPSGVQTLSISQVIKKKSILEFYYLDIQKNTLRKIP